MKTLNLRLEEVAHIRSVLTKAELEAMAIDSTMRDNIARGKVEWFFFSYNTYIIIINVNGTIMHN